MFQNKSTKTGDQQAAVVHRPAQNERRRPIPAQQNLISIQQTLGNQAAKGLLGSALMQPKLCIGQVGDAYEQQAERLADQVMAMKEVPDGASMPAVSDVHPAAMQRVCVNCEDEELRRQTIDEEEEEEEQLLQREVQASTATPGDDNAAGPGLETQVSALRTGGQPLSANLRSFYEPRFNHDFSAVKMHTSNRAAQVAHTVRARAFTMGHDVVFGAGEYQPTSRDGRHLIAHELSHVIQQTPLVARRTPILQRVVKPEAAGLEEEETVEDVAVSQNANGDQASTSAIPSSETPTPETPVLETPMPETPMPESNEAQAESAPGEDVVAPGRIVEDTAQVSGPAQMSKSEFLAELRSQICDSAEQAMAGSDFTAQGCPWIDMYLRFYEGRSAERIESDLLRYAPEAQGASMARDYIPFIAARVRRSVEIWMQTGDITGVPEGIPTGLPGFGLVARLLFKARPGGPAGNPHPAVVQAQLGSGQPLASSVQSRMAAAFGRSFSHVRVHNDAASAGLSNRYNARAFTVGSHVAFGTGEYRPGTLMGDALLAHELAHVTQQQGATMAKQPAQAGQAKTNTLEHDADRAAAGVVASLWGAKGNLPLRAASQRRAATQQSSGLSLQRCKKCCCCVNDVHIENINNYTQGQLYGHRFDLIAELEHKNSDRDGMRDCRLKWEEKTNRIYHHTMIVNKWNDMFALLPTSPTFDPWRNRTKPCPGKETVTINDPPAASVNLPARTLDFRITVESAADCSCTSASKTVTAKQVLVPDGAGGITTQTFTTP